MRETMDDAVDAETKQCLAMWESILHARGGAVDAENMADTPEQSGGRLGRK